MKFKCDVHPWEFAYLGVIDHPHFAVTDKDGKATVKKGSSHHKTSSSKSSSSKPLAATATSGKDEKKSPGSKRDDAAIDKLLASFK